MPVIEGDMMQISPEVFDEIINNGFALVELPNGTMRKILLEDIRFKAEEIHELERKWRSGELPLPAGVTLPEV